MASVIALKEIGARGCRCNTRIAQCSAKVSEYLIELSELREALRTAQKKIGVMEHERESSLALPGVQRALMDMREMLAEQQRRADAATAENELHRAEARRLEEVRARGEFVRSTHP